MRLTVIYFFLNDQEEKAKKTLQYIQSQHGANEVQILTRALQDPLERYRWYPELFSQVQGDYVTVIDEGDQIPEDFFLLPSKVKKKKKKLLISCSKKPLLCLRPEDEYCCENADLSDDGIIDLSETMKSFPITFNGTWMPSDMLADGSDWQTCGIETEKQILFKKLIQDKKYYCFGSFQYAYYYPRDGQYSTYRGQLLKEWYRDAANHFMIPLLQETLRTERRIPRFLQYFAMFFIVCRLEANQNNRDKHLLSEAEALAYRDDIQKILSYVDDAVIVKDRGSDQNFYKKDPLRIRMFLQIKYGDFLLDYQYMHYGNRLFLAFHDYLIYGSGSVRVNVQWIDYRHGTWEMDLSVPSLFSCEHVTYYVELDQKKYPVTRRDEYSLVKYFSQSAYRRISFHASVPIKQDASQHQLRFLMTYQGNDYLLKPSFKSHTSRLSNAYRYAFWQFGRQIAYHKKGTIVIRPAKKWYMMYRECRSLWEMLTHREREVRKVGRLRLLYHLVKPIYGKKKIWMFYDKIYKGGDSSEYLYRYAEKQKDGIETYYLIDRHTPDYRNLKREGFHPLVRGTLKHRLVFLYADLMIISNSTVFAFNDFPMERSAYIRDLVKFHVCCVQHGMSVQKIAIAQKRLRDNIRLYFCASKYEIENLSRPVYDYAGTNALKLSGIPRHDGLVDCHKKQILISPTWRMQAAMLVATNEGVERDYNPLFKETAYFKVYNSLINDQRLLQAAKQYGYRIHYVLHPIVSPQVNDFDQNDYVDVIPAVSDMSYEKEFCESSLMVTDFSGVQFDFAYMRKPVIYLHHDAIPQHYEEGTFHYDTMGFGEIVHDNDSLIRLLIEYMKNGCMMKKEYQKRADDFFAFHDHRNCERVYSILLEHQQEDEELNS